MDARLEEMITLYAAQPAQAFADGGPHCQSLPWIGASNEAKDTTFARFCVSVALRDYRFPVTGKVQAASGNLSDVSVDNHAFVDGLADRGLDGLVLAHGDTALLVDVVPGDTKASDAAIARALEVVKSDPSADLRLLFI